jgi:pyrroline-5-carboxylate reductase
MLTDKTLGVIGVGVMGQALVRGLLSKGVLRSEQVWGTERNEAQCQAVHKLLGIPMTTQCADLLARTDIILLCVKPNKVTAALQQLKKQGLRPETLVMSIAAGVTVEMLESALGSQNPVVRAMPNTPATVGQGLTVICGGSHAQDFHLAQAREVFESVGTCLELEETHFDAVTGLSGSGPAYLFLIMEALADGGVRVGLPRDMALKIVSQMVLGAATMVKETGRHPAALKDDVTTPAGCTIGALLVLEDGKIRSVMARAVEEATNIASQLGQSK